MRFLELLLLLCLATCVNMLYVSSNASQVQLIFSGGETKFDKTTTTTNTNNKRDANLYLEQLTLDNNQLYVQQLVNTLDTHLHNLRKDELCVTAIQEIFDAVHINNDAVYNNKTNLMLQEDLKLFSKRLEQKLEKAKQVILDLRDFLRYNVTRLIQQRLAQNVKNLSINAEDNLDNDYETEDLDSMDDFVKLYINTIILMTTEPEEKADFELHYDKQQILILNEQQTSSILGAHVDLSLEVNTFLSQKMESVRRELLRSSETYELNSFKHQRKQSNMQFLGSHLKHIYFLSSSDHATDRDDAYYDETHLRQLYVSAIQHKYVCLMIDVGSIMNGSLLDLTKSFIMNLLQLLAETDMLQIITVADTAQTLLLETAQPVQNDTQVYLTTRSHKEEIINYLNKLELSRNTTNHTLGFEYAFQQFKILQERSIINTVTPTTFIYLTRGLLSNLSEAMQVLRVIAAGQRTLRDPIRVHTCAVVADEKSLMHEKQFLSDIAAQNYSKYNMNETATQHVLSGKFFVLTKTSADVLMRIAMAIFELNFTPRYVAANLQLHAPIIDGDSRDNIVSISQAVSPFGVVGANLYLSDLIEDIVDYRLRFNAGVDVYAFLIDHAGHTLSHPAFPRPFSRAPNYYTVDISLLENATDFHHIRQRMLSETAAGNAKTTVVLNKLHSSELANRHYYWQSVMDMFIICFVITSERATLPIIATTPLSITAKHEPQNLLDLKTPLQIQGARRQMPMNPIDMYEVQYEQHSQDFNFNLLYHRLDLLNDKEPLCRYFHQLATMDAPTLFLSASSFVSPFTFLHNFHTSNQKSERHTVESIMAYLKDTLGLLANPGLKPKIRNDVKMLQLAMEHLRQRHELLHAPLQKHIIRRYIASNSGILLVYPGCLLTDEYEPTKRPWYRQAMQHAGRIVITAPYLDAGGAGYIVTVAHSILEGKSNALHSHERDRPEAVVALDLPVAFHEKLILDVMPVCKASNIKCILFEHEGYLIVHPSLFGKAGQTRLAEHITHKESFLANDMLYHKSLVRKKACANFLNRTLQRHYRFNTSLHDIFTNVVHNERTKYALTLVPRSNVFAAVLNTTSEGGAFCPCSTIDRVCLNCNRMDQMDCECPCECPMVNLKDDLDILSPTSSMSGTSNYTLDYAYCQPPSEYFVSLPALNGLDNYLPACISINCDVYTTQQKCLAAMGCDWCQQYLDGNLLESPFCTSQANCFNGILAAPSPYDEVDDIGLAVRGYMPGHKSSSYSAFGPVGGAIAVLGIVIGFAIYCYRHNTDAEVGEFYPDSLHEENYGLPLSRFNFDDCQTHEDYGNGRVCDANGTQRNQLINAADISPYHMSSGSSYRRPPNGESDHGYSTMTPHEDSSEHQCFTLAEPLLINDHISRYSKSDTMSISTNISSPTNRQNSSKTQQVCSPTKRLPNVNSPAHMAIGQTQLPLEMMPDQTNIGPQYILAPVTVHRHMETSES